ncbi:endonuclease/exonuclease/phosphatase family protein [Bifidobacterium callitrichidarum]|uniref:Endonuclease n=1 Tax=Bifidobacterium callitrichidarum TaxID=2052941 RepID=A0A2U2MYC4_9BIFI|nr:endonuclease/exonuclease/phosphatase family protein [Bifidobacterium callitrichidarum]PWG62011.1 endonuclease [Bifidobacterium callitrichidarum]
MITFLYIVALIGFLWAALCALPAGAEARMPLPYMVALTPFLWIPLLVGAGVAAWLHAWGALFCLLAAALLTSAQRLSYWGLSSDPLAKRRETHRETPRETVSPARETGRETLPSHFAVMTLNCRYGRADATDIVANVRTRGIDVLALQEVSDDLMARLDAAGIDELLPYRQSGEPKDTDNGGYNVVFSRYKPAAAMPNVVEIPAADVPAITLRLDDPEPAALSDTPTATADADASGADIPADDAAPAILANGTASPTNADAVSASTADSADEAIRTGANADTAIAASAESLRGARTVTFCSAHPKSPMRGCADWSAGILGLRAIANTSAIGDHNIAVVMGDLNSGTDHPSFRALLKAGFKDASLTQGAGPNLTFPRWLKWPRIELDHVLFTPGLKPSGVKSFEIKDTDHLALTATLTVK